LKISGLAALPLLLLAACNDKPNNADIAAAEAKQSRDAANDGRIECALEGAKLFDRTCTVEEITGAEGAVLVVGRSDVGYRRLQITTDGRGVISADGAEVANVSIVDEGVIEVAIGNDRYRLPADTGGVD
jgi:cytochrome c5